MPEHLPENEDHLNQLAKSYLLELKEEPDPSVLYCLQLAEWGLSRLRNTLENLMGEDQKEAYRFLKLAEGGKEYDPLPDLEDVESPEDLARKLLDLLDSKAKLEP
ncbi:MAG: hypothetical protein ABSG44_17500 [Thermodesulfobacteriota bacterium]|jgi:hypothetical protein